MPDNATLSTGKTPQTAKPSLINPTIQNPNTFTNDANQKQTIVSSNSTFSLQIDPNILDNYDVVTYHWKFFMTTLDAVNRGTILELANQTIIAESGVSDLTIDKIELEGIAIPSVEAGTGTQTRVKFEIVEPAGAGLIDQMFLQSISLGIGNWQVQPFYLQLTFRGRDPQTGVPITNGTANDLNSLTWIWPIKVTNVKANVTVVGTRYEFDAIMYNELAQGNAYFSIGHNVVLDNLTTFTQAMSDLQNKLNEDCLEKLIDNYSIPDSYRIIVDPIIASKAKIVLDDKNKSSSRSGDYLNFNAKSASYAAGTSLDKIIDSLLQNTEYFQINLQNSITRDSSPQPINQEKDQMKKLWRIVTETKPIAFDPLRQDNAVAITIYIVEYTLGMVDVDPAQTGQTSDSIDAAKKRFAQYASNRIMKKMYNYIFTGLNDQIVNFDLNMNFSFAASLARFGGYYYDSSINDKGVKQSNRDESQKNATDMLRKTLQWQNNAQPNNASLSDQIAATSTAVKNSTLSPTQQAQYTTLLKYATPAPGQRLVFLTINQQIQSQGGLVNGGVPQFSNVGSAQGYATIVATSEGTTQFISNVIVNPATTQQATDALQSIGPGKMRPVVFRESNQETTNAYGTEATSDPSRARIASIFSTALYSQLDASLQKIKLTIKGDPFWLFPRSIDTQMSIDPITGTPRYQYLSNLPTTTDAVNQIKNAQLLYKNSVNLFGTDNFVIVRFRTPRTYNITTGQIDPYDEVATFSGVYKVVSITSHFEAGKFTQELNCILDPVIDLRIEDLQAAIKNAIQSQAPVQDTTQNSSKTIAPTAVKNNPIQSANLPPGVIQTINQISNPFGLPVLSNTPTSVIDPLANLFPGG